MASRNSMVEQVRTQLFMMLVQQSGPGALPLSNLTPAEFLPFFRRIEETAASQGLMPILVYWSSRDVKWMLPGGEQLKKLREEANCISVFSEGRSDKQDEFCFLVQSQGISMVIYGQCSDDSGPEKIYQCVGSIDPYTVRRAFQYMIPIWQTMDLSEANRLEDIRNVAGSPVTAPHFVAGLRNDWPVVKQRRNTLAPSNELELAIGKGAAAIELPGAKSLKETPLQTPVSSVFNPQLVVRPGAEPDALSQMLPSELRDEADILLEPLSKSLVGNGDTGKKPSRPSSGRGIRELREVWTNITQEVRTIFAPDAQRIIRDIVSQLRISSDLPAILQLAIEEATRLIRADRGLIWQIVDDELVVTNEFATNGHNCFGDRRLGAQESTAIVSEFISRFPDESGSGVIAIPDTFKDTKLRRMSPTLGDLIELGDVKARLVAQIRCRGLIHGFIELQERSVRDWSEQDAAVLQSVSEILSLVVQQSFDLAKIEADASEMKLINEISSIFRESRGQHAQHTLEESVKRFADYTGFSRAQVFLWKEEERTLVPQISEKEHSEPITLSQKKNPFIQVFDSGKLKVVNLEYSKRGDPFFKHDQAFIVPLLSEGDKLGVLALWKRKDGSPMLRPQDRDLAMTVAGSLASFIRADQAIAQIRSERARASLINEVSEKIQDSLKEVEPILETLVSALTGYFRLNFCAVSVFDDNEESFRCMKSDGNLANEKDSLLPNFGDYLLGHFIEPLKHGQIPMLSRADVVEILKESLFEAPEELKTVVLIPLRQGVQLKGALCMASAIPENYPTPPDMHMVKDVLNRVAVVLSHKELFEKVERQAVTDALTGLYNRRYFQEQLSRELDRHQRFGHPFSYIILDLDYLKKINDSLGHQFGDVAIKHIAQVMKKCVRDVDTTARYGGEEFVVLLPETDVEGARIVAERMCTAIREREVEGVGIVTASLGVATFPVDTDDRDKLTELADQALYLAKHQGRNRVCSVSDELASAGKSNSEKGSAAVVPSKKRAEAVSPAHFQAAEKTVSQQVSEKVDSDVGIDLNLIAEHGILGILGTVIKMIEARDMYGSERSPRAAEYAGKIALALRLSKDHTAIISLAAILNILGKTVVDEKILSKPGPLTEEEMKVVQSSPAATARILEPSKQLHRVASVIGSYHEHWDGSGYPKGLQGDDIPLEARIIALVDAYVAMTSDRPYRKALSKEEALSHLKEGSGKEWDPRLVKLFLTLLEKENL